MMSIFHQIYQQRPRTLFLIIALMLIGGTGIMIGDSGTSWGWILYCMSSSLAGGFIGFTWFQTQMQG